MRLSSLWAWFLEDPFKGPFRGGLACGETSPDSQGLGLFLLLFCAIVVAPLAGASSASTQIGINLILASKGNAPARGSGPSNSLLEREPQGLRTASPSELLGEATRS